MGRPSKLTAAQWAEIERRLLTGETTRALGSEFGVAESAIRKRFGAHKSVSAQSAQVRTVAEKIAEANTALEALPPGQRPVAMELSEILRNTGLSLGRAAELGAKNSHRLQHMANTELQKVDDEKPLSDEKSMASLRTVAVLTKMANEAAHIPVNLLNANKERIQKLDDQPAADAPQTSGVLMVPGMVADTAAWSKAAQAALMEADRIFGQKGRYGFTGPGLEAMRQAISLYEDILCESTPRQMANAQSECMRRVRAGQYEQAKASTEAAGGR